jgi:hypothetical protein
MSWPYDSRCAQGPTPGMPVFRELFPYSPEEAKQSDAKHEEARRGIEADRAGLFLGRWRPANEEVA